MSKEQSTSGLSKSQLRNITPSLQKNTHSDSPTERNFRENIQRMVTERKSKIFKYPPSMQLPSDKAASIRIIMEKLHNESHITTLAISNKDIGPEAAIALADALPKSHLTALDVSSNNMGTYGAEALARALPKSYLTTLGISNNDIGPEAALDIAEALPNSHLTKLGIAYNSIADAGARDLAEALPNSHLTELNLANNYIGPDGAEALAEALPNSHLTELNLANNYIGSDGAEALAEALPNSHLRTLDVSGNNIGDKGAHAILAALKKNTTLETISLWGNKISQPLLDRIEVRLAANKAARENATITASSDTIEAVQPQSRVSQVEEGTGKVKTASKEGRHVSWVN